MTREQTWRRLSNNQRLYLINDVVPYQQRVKQSHFIMAIRSLSRIGLIGKSLAGHALTREARDLAAWAIERGYARFDDGQWAFTRPPQVYPWRRVDRDALTELAAAGHYAAVIAEKLGVSREAIRQAAKRYEVTLPRKQKKPTAPKSARAPRQEKVQVRVSADELAQIQQRAAQVGMSVATYVRTVALGDELSGAVVGDAHQLQHLGLMSPGKFGPGDQHLGHGHPATGRGRELEGSGTE